ncbi:hypothetical protein VTL71DRAFT_13149 [Oculimacula yallundae]|uniref:DNA replication factor Cdt1 C-terminal domain-containing protein n=1 Tax=Oculimacula yallundae TaxID=86028 RepID=A0ABR4CS66_9HELO
MPIAIKRRKLATSTKNTTTKSRGLNAFTTVSKASTTTKEIIEKNIQVDTATTIHQSTTGNKRKFVEDEESAQPDTSSLANTLPRKVIPRTPKTPHRRILKPNPSSAIDTPTKGARSLLDQFCISSRTPTRSPLGFNSSISNLAASTPEIPSAPSSDLPTELLDLINLHAAFLTALSIHYAHNGTHSPADLRNLCPDVARAWGKRRVLLEDIRRSIGVLNSSTPEGTDARISRLSLSDYGHGKICIEIRTLAKGGRIARPVNEDLLNEIFERGLMDAWEERGKDMDVKDFVESLPLEAITTCSSLVKMSPLLAKGQRRLEDLKAGITVKETEKEKVVVAGPKLTLLERLRAKQVQQSHLPPPPSKAEIARQAAMGRIEEVVAILVILSTSTSIGQSRISFTLPTIIGKLRDSFKTPMSKEEADTCIRVLATDIAPEWVKLVKMGKVEALVVNRDERPGELVIKERVGRA